MLDLKEDIYNIIRKYNILGVSNMHSYIRSGYVYVAIRGFTYDGHDFIKDAILKGSIVVFVEDCPNRNIDIDIEDVDKNKDIKNVPIIKVKNTRYVISILAQYFYNKQPDNVVAITGTNGKTSTSYFYAQLINNIGYNSAAIGTLGLITFDGISKKSKITKTAGNLTTSDPITLHSMLEQLSDEGCNYVALEASSFGLDQYRLDSVKFKAAGFTNFTQDHLDYHKTFENYFNAKKRLFNELLLSDGIAVLNSDSPEFYLLKEVCDLRKIKIISYGIANKNNDFLVASSDIMIANVRNKIKKIKIFTHEYDVEIDLSFIQLSNILCAVGLAIATGFDADNIVNALPYMKTPPGRMEKITEYNGATIYVDYAHTPDALEKILINAREDLNNSNANPNINSNNLNAPKLYVVFGCGGERDKLKRPIMGEIAVKLADYVVVTDDNPRNENAKDIRNQVVNNTANNIGNIISIEDRKKAIEYAINKLKSGDMLIIAGKGGEECQIIGDVKYDYNDKYCILDICAKYKLHKI